MTDDHSRPVSDPAAAGYPETADHDSTADPDQDTARAVDGPDPATLPPERGDLPLGVEEFGTTAEEQRAGESLDRRLAREEPDTPGAGRDDRSDPTVAGELVEPDEGAHPDAEPDAVAEERGGLTISAEELAIHELPETLIADESDQPPGPGSPPESPGDDESET